MGLNSFFAVICGNMAAMLKTDYTSAFQATMCIILVEGIVFLLLSVFNIRDKIVTAIPLGVRLGIGHGIGLAMISHMVIKVFSGHAKEVSVLTYVISALFLVKFFAVV